MSFRTVLRVAVLLVPVCLALAGQDPRAPRLSIVVPEGESAINNIKQRTTPPIETTPTGAISAGSGAALGPPQ